MGTAAACLGVTGATNPHYSQGQSEVTERLNVCKSPLNNIRIYCLGS